MSSTSDPRKGKPSASKTEQLTYCPGSWAAQLLYSQDDSTDASESGDRVHDALAFDDPDALNETEEVIYQRLKERRGAALLEWCESKGLAKDGGTEIVEQRFWFRDEMSAQIDFAFIEKTGKHAILMDFKTGWKEVTKASRNLQLRSQAVCLWQHYKKLESIRCCIAAYRFRESFTHTDYDVHGLLYATRDLQLILHRIHDPNAPRVPGEWCRYCRAKANCWEAAAAIGLMPVAVAKQDEDVVRAVARLTPAQLLYINERRSLAESVFVAVANRIRNLDEKDLDAIGIQLSPQQKTRYKDVYGLAKALVDAGLIQKEEFAQCVDVVMQRVADLAIPRLMEAGVPSKKAAAERIRKVVEPYAERYNIAPRIVRKKREIDDRHERQND